MIYNYFEGWEDLLSVMGPSYRPNFSLPFTAPRHVTLFCCSVSRYIFNYETVTRRMRGSKEGYYISNIGYEYLLLCNLIFVGRKNGCAFFVCRV